MSHAHIVIVPAAITGQTPLYSEQTQDWARQSIYDKGIECYCLDAPDMVPTGALRVVGGPRWHGMTQVMTTSRDAAF